MTRPSRKDEIIRIPISAEEKALLSRAAAVRGQKLSEFVLTSALHEAELTILDQREFQLGRRPHAAFDALLDAPPKPNSGLKRLMSRKASWDC